MLALPPRSDFAAQMTAVLALRAQLAAQADRYELLLQRAPTTE
jgi:hypothetical protein